MITLKYTEKSFSELGVRPEIKSPTAIDAAGSIFPAENEAWKKCKTTSIARFDLAQFDRMQNIQQAQVVLFDVRLSIQAGFSLSRLLQHFAAVGKAGLL